MTNPAYEATNSDVEKVEKKKNPSDNYLNEILTNTEFAAVVPIEAVRCMARELMLLRTSAPNGMMQLSNELAEMKRKLAELKEQKDKWAAWAIALGAKADELESRPLCVKSNDAMREAAPLCVKLPGERFDDDGSITSDFDRGWDLYREEAIAAVLSAGGTVEGSE